MSSIEEKVLYYEKKLRNCTTMTDLLVVMSSWQSFSRSNGLPEDQKRNVDRIYLEMEEKLIAGLSKSPW